MNWEDFDLETALEQLRIMQEMKSGEPDEVAKIEQLRKELLEMHSLRGF